MLDLFFKYVSPLFYHVLYMSIIGIVVGLFILIIRKVLDKKISPKWKCVIWFLLLISLVIPIKFDIKSNKVPKEMISISGLLEPIQNFPKQQDNHLEENTKTIQNTQEGTIEENNLPIQEGKKQMNHKLIFLYKILPFIWILGIIINLLFLIIGSKNIKAKTKGKIYQEEDFNKILVSSQNCVGITKTIKVIVQKFKKTPCVLGIIHTKILITKDFLKQDEKSQKYILMHELCHIKRRDLILNYVLLMITSIHWFNPFIWFYFKKIRQDMELATDEMVLNQLNQDEKKEYGKTLLNSLSVFQEEPYTAKLLCITDDNDNIERRIKMIKLSEKFRKNKLIIAVLSILIVLLGVGIFFTTNKPTRGEQSKIEEKKKQEVKYEYKAFKPSFKKTSQSTYDDYDFTQDMKYMDNIYYRKISNYEEYKEVKARWNAILDMNESDFENNFMVITAIENTSMLGLTVDKIETDDNSLYISLRHYEDNISFDENETCISYIISRDKERENIYVTRNLRDSEKDMKEGLQLAEKNDFSSQFLTFQYRDQDYRDFEDKSLNRNYKVVPQDWKDSIAKDFTIYKDMPEIQFSNWNSLGNDFYSIAITDYSEYLKLINHYDVPKLTWYDFKYIYVILIVRANPDNTISVSSIETENGNSYLNVSTGAWLDVSESFQYPGIWVAVPNYRSLENNFLQVRVVE